MTMKLLIAAGIVAVLTLPGCKLVKTSQPGKDGAAAGAAQDGIETLVATTFDSKLVPALQQKAVDLPTLLAALKGGLDTAGQSYGVRVGGQGGGWNFAIKGTALVVEEDLVSKAAVAKIDVDNDGKPDAILQLGPVIKGTALRDTTPLYDFSSFRDQIEYARLGRALNDKAVYGLSAKRDAMKGKTVTFLGAAAIRSAGEAPLITPVSIEIKP